MPGLVVTMGLAPVGKAPGKDLAKWSDLHSTAL